MVLFLGFPLFCLVLAIALMVWRALHPKRNAIRGLTNARGVVVNPFLYWGMSLIGIACVSYASWRLFWSTPVSGTAAGRLSERLELWLLLSTGTGLARNYIRQGLRWMKLRDK